MTNYLNDIMSLLPGETPKQKYEALVKMLDERKWISVNERLPENKGFYLVIIDESISSKIRGQIEIGECFETVKDDKICLKFHEYVLFWQPLPKPIK